MGQPLMGENTYIYEYIYLFPNEMDGEMSGKKVKFLILHGIVYLTAILWIWNFAEANESPGDAPNVLENQMFGCGRQYWCVFFIRKL